MNEELKAIVQRMIDAGEPEENIKLVIQSYSNEPGKTIDPASSGMDSGSENGSLKSTENLSQEERQKLSDEAYSIKERRTVSGKVIKGSMSAVYADNTVNIIKSLVTDKKEREEIVEGLGNIVDEKANNLLNVFWKTGPAEISRIYKNIAFNDLYDQEELDYLKTQDPNASYEDPSGDPTGFKTNADRIKYLEGYKETSAAKQEEKINKFITEKYKEVEVYNKYLRKDTGEGIVKGVKQGDASDVVLGVFNAGASMAETVVPAMITGGWSLPFQITAPMLMDYNQQKAERIYGKDDPNAVAKLLENKEDEIAIPAALGLVATSLEYVGYRGITNYILGKPVKRTVAKLLLTGNKEGWTELGQSGIDEVNSALAQGKEGLDIGKAFIDGVFSEKGLESYLQGFIGGAGMSAGGKAINRALRSDNASVKEFNSLINNYAEFTLARNKTTNKKHKEILDLQVKKIEKKITDFVKNKRKIASILNKDQQASLIDLMNQKDQNDSEIQNLQKSLQDNQITKKDAGYILRSLNNENKRIAEKVELINESAKQQLLVTGLEAAKEEGETVGLKQEVFETKEQYAALFGEKGSKKYNEALKADGHISDDGSTYYVNMDTARETGAIGVGSHELLHAIIGKSFSKLSTEAKTKLNKNFLDLLSEKDRKTVLNRLAGAYGITGDKVFTTEELYTAFSDVIIDGDVTFNEGAFGKVKNAFEEILRQLSSAGYFAEESFLYRKEFGNARQAYNFVKDYSLTIKKTGKVTGRAKKFAKVDPSTKQEKPRYNDKQVPVKTEEFKVTTTDGDVIIYKATTQLDGTIKWTKKGKNDAIFVPANVADSKIMQRDNISPRQAMNVFEKDGFTVEVGKVGDYKTVMNPKMFDRLTSDQQRRVDSKRAKETKGKVNFSRSGAVDAVNKIEQVLTKRLQDQNKEYTQDEFRQSDEFNKLFDSITETNGAVNNYIKSLGMSREKTQQTIQKVSDRLMGYNPKAERKTGSKKVITIGERIMSDAQFAKLDAAKELAIKNKKEDKTLRIDAAKRTQEGESTFDLEDTGVDAKLKALETEDMSPAAQAKKKAEEAKGKQEKQSKFRKALGIQTGGVLYMKVLDAARKSLLRAYSTKDTVRQVQRNLRDQANKYLFKDIKNFLGTNKYQANLKQYRENIIESLFVADLVQMEREVPEADRVFTKFVKKLTTKQEVEDAVNQNLLPPSAINAYNKDKSVNLYKKGNPTEKQFLSYFMIPTINPVTGLRSGKKGTRKDTLAKNMAGALAYDATMEVAQEPEVAQMRADLAEARGESLLADNIEQLAVAIGRNPNIKFSISTEQVNQGIDIIEGKNKNDGFGGKNWQKYYDDPKINNETKHAAQEEYLNRLTEENDAISKKELDKLDYFKNGKKRKTKIRTYKKYEIIAKQRAEKIINNLGLDKQGYKVESLSEKDNNPDIRITRNGKTVFTIEIKGNTARGVSVSFNYKKDGKGLVKSKKAAEKQETENYNKQEESLIKFANKVFEKMIKLAKPNEVIYSRFNNLQISAEGVNRIKEKGLQLEIHGKQFFINPDDFANSYRQKKGKDGSSRTSNAIDIGNAGMFLMDSNSIMQVEGLKNFSDQKVLIPLTARISFKLNTAKTHYTVSVRVEPQINSLFFDKQDISLINKSGNKNFVIKKSVTKDVSTGRNLFKASRSDMSKSNGASIFDFDETVGVSENFVIAKKDNITEKIPSYEWPLVGETLKEQGYEFDFTDFNKVTKGKPGPLLQKMKNQIEKYGSKNVFILTARAPESAVAIHEWLQSEGVNIPLENVTGLGNSTGEAKATWILDKYAEKGYNDIYFVDDALQNVQAVKNMFDQLDIKGKSVQARVKFSKSMNDKFNDILEDVTGIETQKRFSAIKGRKRGDDKGKFRFFIPPSHEDFVGLLYNFMGEGRKGDAHRDFLEQALVRPLNRAYRELDTAKQAIANDYKKLNEQFPDVNDKLIKTTPDGDFTFQDAIRVYLWNKHGHKIPGLTETDQAKLTKLVESDPQLQAYAETLNIISKQEEYVAPGQAWETANIRIDLVDATGRVGRAQYLSEFIENADVLFSEENLNKIEAGYGKDFREALEDMLHRIKTGVNRPKGQSGKPNRFLNWLNASVAGVMFFNTRSALLQQLSNVNYLNFADNNILAAGKAFANQKQYWKDFAFILNSDMLKQRRGGIGTDVNGAELVEAIKKARPDSLFDQVAIITGKLLRLGFLPTQMGDSIAIATGGAAFYRNRINTYLKQGLSQKEAEAKAFTDFQDITQSTQQSARPDMTSQQQASWIGKLVLNFLNTPSQYNRIIKKAGSDLKNRRITKPNTTQTQSDMSNLSRILYYGAAQNLIFYGLQTALFAVMFGTEDDDESEAFLKKKERVINGSIDTILRGSGIYGVAISTLKNMLIKFAEQREKGYNKDESAVIMEALNFSPVLGIRARKIVNAEKTLNYNTKVIDEMTTFDIDNPQWSAVTNYVEGTTTLPVNRLYQKTINVRNALDNQYTAFQRAMFFSGYTTWSLDLGDTEKMKKIKEKVKNKKKSKGRKTFKRKTLTR